MSKVVSSEVASQTIGSSRYVGIVVIVGIISGAIYYYVSLLVGRYFAVGVDTANNLATTIVLLIGLAIMGWQRIPRSILIVAASGVALWNLGGWTSGLSSAEALLWSIVIYALVYGLFASLTRYQKTWAVVVLSLLSAVAINLLGSL